jgi:SNF2 family DNA or RNA helicase
MKLFKHQEAVLEQTEQFSHVGYFLDMGLGKTFVGSEKMLQLGSSVNLIICQKSKVEDWFQHFEKYYSQYMVFNLTDRKDFELYMNADMSWNVVGIINYELAFRRGQLTDLRHFTLMLDESQYIQNEMAKRSKFLLKMQPDNVILLSGTPTSGKYEQLWSQVQLLGWQISKKAYWNTYVDTKWIEDQASGFKREVVIGYKNTERLKRKLAEHGAVFMKTEECFELPEQQEIMIRVASSKEYWKFMHRSVVTVVSDEGEAELVGDCVLTKLLYARQLCGMYSKEKLEAFADLISSTADRVIVFYNFTAELYAMEHIVEQQERPYSVVNGMMKDLTDYEEQPDSITFVQYQSGAMGLNLQKAHITVYFTLPLGKGSCSLWEQSKKRIHRIGQEQKCLYYYMLCSGSIEEHNLEQLKEGKEYNDQLFEKECT